MAIYRSTHVGLYRNYNANNNFESIAVVNVAKDGYSPKVQAQSWTYIETLTLTLE